MSNRNEKHHRIRRAALPLLAAGGLIAVAAPAAAVTPVEASIPVPGCCPAETVATGGNVLVLSDNFGGTEQSTIVKIDPSTNAVTAQITLPPGSPTGNSVNTTAMAVVAGSLWVVQYFHDEVLRIDPSTLAVTATVSTGRSPSSITSDGKALWVSLSNDGAIARIDPATNRQTLAVPVGSRKTVDQPYQVAFDGKDVLASMPGSGRVVHVDPKTHTVHYDRVGYDAAACAHILPTTGGYWLDDTECAYTYYRWDYHAHAVTATVDPEPLHDFGAVVVGNALYAGEFDCPDDVCTGWLAKYDATTGAALGTETLGADATMPHFAAGELWVGDWVNHAIQRVSTF